MAALVGALAGTIGITWLAANGTATPPSPTPSAVTGPASGAMTSNVPVDVAHRGVTGAKAADGYGDLLFAGVYVIPYEVNVGQILNEVTHSIELWNATDADLSLTGVDEVGTDGCVLSGQPVPPWTLGLKSSRFYTLTVSNAGPGTIDAQFTWVFGDFPTPPTLAVTGSRIIAFTERHEWSNGLTERLAWKTDVIRAHSGIEQRVSHRLYPRREWDCQHLQEGPAAARLENRVFAMQGASVLVPLWRDWQPLAGPVHAGALSISCVTDYLAFAAGERAILWRDNGTFEALEVESVGAGSIALSRAVEGEWAAGDRLIPARYATLLQSADFTREAPGVIRVALTFAEEPGHDQGDLDPAAVTLDTYYGIPIYMVKPEASRPGGAVYDRELVVVDSGTGALATYVPRDYPLSTRSFRWLLDGRGAVHQLRGLFATLKGRLGAFWLPTWEHDLVLASPVGAGDAIISVLSCGYVAYVNVAVPRKDILIRLKDGTVYRRYVVSAALGTTTDALTLDSALGAAVQPEDVDLICYLELRRLDQDQVEIFWHTGSVAEVEVHTVGVLDAVTRGPVV